MPILRPLFVTLETLSWNGVRLSANPRWFVMGQICVADGYRGMGIFDGLYLAMAEEYRDRFDFTVTEVAARNRRSLRAHARVGFQTLHVYPDATTGQEWHVIVLDFGAVKLTPVNNTLLTPVVLAMWVLLSPVDAGAQSANARPAPGSPTADNLRIYVVDPSWPPTLPNDWILGDIGGLFADDNDHLWVIHMPSSLTPQEIGAAVKPPIADCCVPAPPVLELDPEGKSLDPELIVSQFSTLEDRLAFSPERMDVSHRDTQKNAVLFPIFAAVALLIAVIGLYATVACAVSRRTQEIGIRMALGAETRAVHALVIRHAVPGVAAGLIIGIAASLAGARVLESQMVGISPFDPVSFGMTAIVLIATAASGCLLPARRAARVDPAIALRHE